MAKIFVDEIARSWEEEGLFARDVNGQLIRAEEATARQYEEYVTITIDGQTVSVPRATPAVDSQGNIIRLDASGRTQPRLTTILDARNQLAREQEKSGVMSDGLCEHFIPTLCHAEHLKPAGVCRVCSVAVGRKGRDDSLTVQDKLVPACVQPVQPGMQVFTLDYPERNASGVAAGARARVRSNVKTLLQLLTADHLPATNSAAVTENDLQTLLETLQEKGIDVDSGKLAPRLPKTDARDTTSPLIRVDHSACILCDRCVRSCSDIKHNFVIGRTGKGYESQIGFDLNVAMGSSTCVECGECALACPTSALTFVKPPEEPEWWLEQVGGKNQVTGKSFPGHPRKRAVTPEELADHPIFGLLSLRQRQWLQYSIVRWELIPDEELCVTGEYGFTAYLIESGTVDVWLQDPREQEEQSPGFLQNLFGWFSNGPRAKRKLSRAELGEPNFQRGKRDIILGEMTLISHRARSATLRAQSAMVVYEIRRNVLYALQRIPAVREKFDRVYRGRALRDVLQIIQDRKDRNLTKRLFGALGETDLKACLAFLEQASQAPVTAENPKRQVDLVRVEPGQDICRQDELAEDFFIIRLGHVKVTKSVAGEDRVIDYLRPTHTFGETACIADWDQLPTDVGVAKTANRRTATCTALDDVELIRIDKQTFRRLLLQVPALLQLVVERAKRMQSLRPATERKPGPAPATNTPILREFTEQGLYNGQKLLVLDLEACTRCDECTKACADTHEGVTRLIREGLRFDKWLVASSCRSCTDPYCLVGCPVDAIHRDGDRMEIQIEQHCIGCGLCANNCPYGNINMHGQQQGNELKYRATTCDLCQNVVGKGQTVSCVFACPHNAAFRMSGPDLLETLQGKGYQPV